MIQREKVKNEFQTYVRNYDRNDTKIRLKEEHTYRVAELSDELAASLHMDRECTDLAWLIGMLHDIGRFEQLRRYGTFQDAVSVDHAKLGTELLFSDGMIRRFTEEAAFDEVIRDAISYHNAYRLPDNLDARTLQFGNIIRDADKIDILRVNVEIPMEEIYNIPSEEFYTSAISEEVVEAFEAGDTVLRSLKRTAADYLVGHISLVNGLVFPKSQELVREQGYLRQMVEFPTENEQARRALKKIKDRLEGRLL